MCYFVYQPIQDPYLLLIVYAAHDSPYHGYNYSYLIFTSFIGSSYVYERLVCKNVTYINLYVYG